MKIYSFQWNHGKIVDCFKHNKLSKYYIENYGSQLHHRKN